jgi:hypothetical protein
MALLSLKIKYLLKLLINVFGSVMGGAGAAGVDVLGDATTKCSFFDYKIEED